MSDLPEHVARNRAFWNEAAAEWVEPGRDDWAAEEPPLGRLPGTRGGARSAAGRSSRARRRSSSAAGPATFPAWLARRGARPIGIDNSEEQLATARALQREFGIEFPLLHGNAEEVPLPDASFDLAISEYGASIWCDPYRWIPEASRLLRPGGELVFLVNSVFTDALRPRRRERAGDRPHDPALLRDAPLRVAGDGSVEFHLPHGEMIALLRKSGFEVEELIEVRPPGGSTTRFSQIDLEWAQRWPVEEVWRARKRA